MNPGQVRAGNGQFKPSPEATKRDARAAELRSRGLTYRAIAEQLGYSDQGHAAEAVKRAMMATVQEAGEEAKRIELDRLDGLWRKGLEVLERFHPAVSSVGTVIEHRGEVLVDDAPVLNAIDRLLKIQERRARLLGLDAPVKHEVRNVDAIDSEIDRLLAQLGSGGQAAVAAAPTSGAGAGAVDDSGTTR